MNLREEELRRNAELNKEAVFERKLNESSKKLLKYEKYIYSTFRDGDSLSVLYTGETTPFSAFDYGNMLSPISSLTSSSHPLCSRITDFLFLEPTQHFPALGHLNLLFVLPGMLFNQT